MILAHQSTVLNYTYCSLFAVFRKSEQFVSDLNQLAIMKVKHRLTPHGASVLLFVETFYDGD